MKDGISSYPKHFILMLLSDVTELLHILAKTTISEDTNDKEKVNIFEEMLLNKDSALLYLTINTIMQEITINEDEMRNIQAELKLHKDTHEGAYEDIQNLFLETELSAVCKSLGIIRPDDSEEDDS